VPTEPSASKDVKFVPKRTSKVKESCESCGDPGDLLYCETCSLAYHPECEDPPLLDVEKIANIAYECRQCRHIRKANVWYCLKTKLLSKVEYINDSLELRN